MTKEEYFEALNSLDDEWHPRLRDGIRTNLTIISVKTASVAIEALKAFGEERNWND